MGITWGHFLPCSQCPLKGVTGPFVFDMPGNKRGHCIWDMAVDQGEVKKLSVVT